MAEGELAPETSRLLDTFLAAVRIDSPTGEEAVFARWCAERLEELGGEVRTDASAAVTGSDTGNVIAEFPGTVSGTTLVFSCHLDTVEPSRGIEPVVRDGVVTSSGDTVLGADDKAGVAAVFETLARLREGGLARPHIRVLLTTGEEIGLHGAKALEPAACEGDLCLVLDADGPPGGIVVAAPTHFTFKATFSGRAAHAGVQPERGISAIRMAADAISRMRLGRVDAETTANIGTICGGCATNVIAPSCDMTGECRSLDAAKAECVRLEMDSAMRDAAERVGGGVAVEWVKEYVGYRFAYDDPLLLLVEGACGDAGLTPYRFETGGGSDGNVLAAAGLPTLVLSCGMDSVHCTDENVAVADIEAMVRLLLAVVARVASR